MRMVVMVVRDVRADVFGNPFFMQSMGQAERQFADEINRASEDNVMYKHPQDFELYHLGFYDAETAQFDLSPRPAQLCDGTSVARRAGDGDQLRLVK